MKKVRISYPHHDKDILTQTPFSSGKWLDYQFYVNQDVECDYWVIFNFLNSDEENSIVPKKNIILITGEPTNVYWYHPYYINQFSHVITSQRNIVHPRVHYCLQGLPWYVGKSYDELLNEVIIKEKQISLISSNKTRSEGHKKRLQFSYKLKEYFQDSISLYGRGINDFNNKWDVLAPYKYSIAIENGVYKDYISEKIYDCFLAETFPFYYGSPSINKYINKNAYQLIDINNFKKSVEIIKKTLDSPNHYENSLPYLKEEKDRYLLNYQLFPFIISFLEKLNYNSLEKERITLKNIHYFIPQKLSFKERFFFKINRTINKLK